MDRYTSKEMAELIGVSIPTLRYYERIGLLDRVRREANGHRRYGEKDVLRVQFLKRLRATGMPIREMQRYVDLFRAGDSTLLERIDMLETHREVVLAQMTELQDTVDLLDMKIDRYQKQIAAANSEVVETL
jgi:DNA-binding transcriptional MerR regulator